MLPISSFFFGGGGGHGVYCFQVYVTCIHTSCPRYGLYVHTYVHTYVTINFVPKVYYIDK